MWKAAAKAGQVEENMSPASHLDVSLYCMAPKRIPVALTELANGLMIPAMKPFTWRKLAWPILEEPSTRKTISAACTLLHLPTNTMKREHMRSQWSYCLKNKLRRRIALPWASAVWRADRRTADVTNQVHIFTACSKTTCIIPQTITTILQNRTNTSYI